MEQTVKGEEEMMSLSDMEDQKREANLLSNELRAKVPDRVPAMIAGAIADSWAQSIEISGRLDRVIELLEESR